MKQLILILFYFFIISKSICHEINRPNFRKYDSKISLNISIAPNYSWRKVNNYGKDVASYQYFAKNQSGYIFFNYNFLLNYYFKNTWSIELGIIWANYGNKVNNVKIYNNDSISVKIRYRFVSIPIGIQKEFTKNKIVFSFSSGIRNNFLRSFSMSSTDDYNKSFLLDNAITVKSFFISTYTSFGLYLQKNKWDYFIKSTLNLTPFNVGKPSNKPNNLTLHFYQIGIELGIRKKMHATKVTKD